MFIRYFRVIQMIQIIKKYYYIVVNSPSRAREMYFLVGDEDLADLNIDNNAGNSKTPVVTIPALKVSRFGKTA